MEVEDTAKDDFGPTLNEDLRAVLSHLTCLLVQHSWDAPHWNARDDERKWQFDEYRQTLARAREDCDGYFQRAIAALRRFPNLIKYQWLARLTELNDAHTVWLSTLDTELANSHLESEKKTTPPDLSPCSDLAKRVNLAITDFSTVWKEMKSGVYATIYDRITVTGSNMGYPYPSGKIEWHAPENLRILARCLSVHEIAVISEAVRCVLLQWRFLWAQGVSDKNSNRIILGHLNKKVQLECVRTFAFDNGKTVIEKIMDALWVVSCVGFDMGINVDSLVAVLSSEATESRMQGAIEEIGLLEARAIIRAGEKHNADLCNAAMQRVREVIDEMDFTNAMHENGVGEDPSFVLASYLLGGSIKRIRDVWRILNANPTIQWKRPKTKDGREDPRRVLVHAGQWIAAVRATAGNPNEIPECEVDAYVKGVEQRKAAASKEVNARN